MESIEEELQTVNLNESVLNKEIPCTDSGDYTARPPSRPQSVASVSSSIVVDFESQLTFDTNFVEENAGNNFVENLTCNELYEKEERPSSVCSNHSSYSQQNVTEAEPSTSYLQTNGYQEAQHRTYDEQMMHNSTFHNGPVGEQIYEYAASPIPMTSVPGTPVPHFSRPSSSCSHSSIAADFAPQTSSAGLVNQHYSHQQAPQNLTPYGQQSNSSQYNYYEPTANYQQPYHSQSYPAPYYQSNPYYSGYFGSGPGNVPPYQPPQFPNNSFQTPNVPRNYEMGYNRYYDHNVPQNRSFDMNSSYRAFNTPSGGYPPGSDPLLYQEWFAKYTQWWYDVYAHSRQRRGERQRLTPLPFPTKHSRVTFGSKNLLIVVSGQSVILQQLDSSLIDVGSDVSITTWPGPLVKSETDKNVVLEYIRTQEVVKRPVITGYEEETYYYNHQRKQMWQLLLMLVRQNGVVSGADLAELLITNNEIEFETGDEGTDTAKLRNFLMFGHKTTALDFSTKSGQWGHAFALSFLTASREMQSPSTPSQMVNLVTKFINSNVNHEDPLYVLYRCLLQKIQDYYSNIESKSVPITNLPQFAILLANDCDVTSQTISGSNLNTELLKSIVAIRNNESQYFIKNNSFGESIGNQHSFSEEHLFINEIFEFGRNWQEIVYDLIPYKTVMAAKLFDFGLLNQSQNYCRFIRNTYYAFKQVFGDSDVCANVNWNLVMKVVNQLESRLLGYDVGHEGEVREEVCDVSNSHEFETKCEEKKNEVSVENGTDSVAVINEVSSNVQSVNPPPPPAAQKVTPKASLTDVESKNFSNEQKVTEVPVKKVPLWRQRQSSLSDKNNFDQRDKDTPPATPKEIVAPTPPLASKSQPSQPQMNFFIPPEPSPSDPVPDFVSSANLSVNNTIEDENSDYYNQALQPHTSFNSTRNDFNPKQKVFTPPLSPITSPTFENSDLKTSKIDDFRGDSSRMATKQNTNENEKPAIPDNRSKGFLDSAWSTFSKLVPSGPKRAILPDDKNPSIVWDGTKWVDKNEDPNDEANKSVMNGPPKIPLQTQPQMFGAANVSQKQLKPQIPNFSPSQLQFTKSKQRRYVDILQQQKAS